MYARKQRLQLCVLCAPPPSPAWANFTLMIECTPESSGCNSVYSVHPHLHQPGLILPSWLNVRQKAAVATLCTLWYQSWLCVQVLPWGAGRLGAEPASSGGRHLRPAEWSPTVRLLLPAPPTLHHRPPEVNSSVAVSMQDFSASWPEKLTAMGAKKLK